MHNNNLKILENIESKTKIYLVIIAILLIILSIKIPVYIVPSFILYGLILIYTVWVYRKRRGELSSYIDKLTFTVDTAAKSTLINSPFPLLIVQADGKVIWRSVSFNQEFANAGIDMYVDSLLNEIKNGIEQVDNQKNNHDMKIARDIDIDGQSYHVIGDYIKIRKKERRKQIEYMFVLYFINDTEKKKLEKRYENSQTCIGIVVIDNYDEIVQRLSEENKSHVMALVEKKLYEWASQLGGLMIKKERDIFTFIFEKIQLDQMEKNKFAIIDEIKEIETEEKMPVTLSIAISNEGENNYEKHESAVTAIDIALGRGGDQVIVRRDGKYIFFGGKSQEVEKITKVKARTISHALEQLIMKAEKVMIMGHINGDIDSIGSSLGLYRFAKNFSKEVYIINNTYGLTLSNFMETLMQNVEYKSVIIDRNSAISKITENTLLIITDTHKKGYVEVPELLEKTDKIVIIDHHRKAEDFIDNAILNFHETYASSASELVTEIIEYASEKIKLENIEAEALYAGIMTDTKNFAFKTGVRTFEAAAYLKKYGIDIIKVKKWFQSDLENYNLIADIVKNSEVVRDTIGIAIYQGKDKNANLICAKAADELLTINNITTSFVLGQIGDKIHISGRSIGDINVQVILEKMRWRRTYNVCGSTAR